MTHDTAKLSSGLGLGLSLGGVAGMIAVIASAYSSHIVGSSYIDIIAQMMMLHAGAFIAMGIAVALTRSRFVALGMLLVFGGLGLFCGDLALRFFVGRSLFLNAAPFGGLLMIVGWLFVALGGIARAFKRR
ncbi:DUF423 domain-containing protein [Rhodobacteraceae bacterium RKSG542]|uniref:DUF423 domain-containing protein n=1 Tax=Pseudovibrio flavus TaxID=2529854 RepID=UPI0012BC1C2D|nr:DUF423 domain-containing protein [Pseudovibrio flavus]MTI17328.1 DUF423 domain-containing protein [Pseudovibrio flavus]